MKIGKSTITETGLFIPARWYRKEANIPWDDIRQISLDKQIIVVYEHESGKLKKAVFKYDKDEFNRLADLWESRLVEKIRSEKQLSGSIIVEPSEISLVVSLLFSIILTVFILFSYYQVYSAAPPDVKSVLVWLLYYVVIGILPFPALLSYSFIMLVLKKNKWSCWKIDKDGFFIKGAYHQWNKIRFDQGDVITHNLIKLGGRQIPWHQFTYNQMIPYLLFIAGRNAGISPGKGNVPLAKESIRLFLFWPFALTAIWYLPLLFTTIPATEALRLKVYLMVIFSGCIVFGLLLAGVSYFEKRQALKEYGKFMSKTDQYRERLGW